MKKIILVLAMVVMMSSSVLAGAECFYEGEFEVPDFADDVECKMDVWDGNRRAGDIAGECMRVNELAVQGLVNGTNNGTPINSISNELNQVANEASSDEYLTPTEVSILFDVANNFSGKLLDFQRSCSNKSTNPSTFNGSEYLDCKLQLTDMIKDLGQAAKIVWYTPDAFFKVQVLEDMQENFGHILAAYDKAAIGSFAVVCEEEEPWIPIGAAVGPLGPKGSLVAGLGMGVIGLIVLIVVGHGRKD